MRVPSTVALVAFAVASGSGITRADAQDVVVATAAGALAPTAAQRDSTPTAKRDSTVPAKRDSTATKDAAAPFGIKLSGYVETAFNYANGANGKAITGRLYERSNNQFALNALKISMDRAFDPTKMDAGFHADVIFGQNAPVLQSAGFNVGPNGDVYQVYGTLNMPTANGNGVQVKVGRMATFMGLEVIETPLNPNVSIANQFIYTENFTQTGLSVEHRFNRVVDAQVRVLNGWDQVQDANGSLSYMARVGIAPNDQTSIAFVGYTGAEQADNDAAMRTGAEVLASRRIGRVTAFVQGDYGREQANSALPDSTRNASWWAGGAWLVIDASRTVGVALRADYMNDRHAARTGAAFGLTGAAAHRISSATATLNLKGIPNVLIRPELRYDRSNQPVFKSQNGQVSVGLSAAYLF
jgi:hypothetical protein